MKKKISVFALLLSLMLAVLVPVQLPVPVQAANSTETNADDVKYKDIEDFMHSKGYTSFVREEGYYYIFVGGDSSLYYYLYKVKGSNDNIYFCSNDTSGVIFLFGDDVAVTKMEYYSYTHAASNNNYNLLKTSEANKLDGYYNIKPDNPRTLWFTHNGVSQTYYSDVNIYQCNFNSSTKLLIPSTDVILYESNIDNTYTFEKWCSDAGLNCKASSNESSSVIPYSYNDYWHIVRKTSSGNWLLTTIGSTLGQSKMNLRLSDSGDLIIYEFSGDDSFVISVRQYVYDTDGWKVRTYDTYDYDNFSSGLLTLPAGSGLDDTRVLAYTSTDIYASDGLSVYAATSTEYIEPSVPVVTPEPTPGSGSSGSGDSDNTGSSGGGRPGFGTRPSVGGEASGGGGLDFIINLFTLIWTKICAVPMSVDGYSISLQQLFVYGALVSIVGGFIMKFIFRR